MTRPAVSDHTYLCLSLTFANDFRKEGTRATAFTSIEIYRRIWLDLEFKFINAWQPMAQFRDCINIFVFFLVAMSLPPGRINAQNPQTIKPQQFRFSIRASAIDSRVTAYPKINFLVNDAQGKPVDLQHASVDTRIAPKGKLVIWLMSHNAQLFDRLNSYGLHVIRVHYANKWFSICCQDKPVSPHCRGNIRLEAATGKDFSDEVEIAKPDGMMERAFQYVKWLAKSNPEGNWEQFLNQEQNGLNWEKVIISGSSHGSTTAARFAKHQKVARVVMLCGPRDQFQDWQSLPSATPQNRYFGFSHVLDSGWTADHYCRSWELLGMHQFGPIVNVEHTQPPFENSRRLVTDFDVGGNAKKAHSAVQPGRNAQKDPITGKYSHENVWNYLFTHPVDQIGEATPPDAGCLKSQNQQP